MVELRKESPVSKLSAARSTDACTARETASAYGGATPAALPWMAASTASSGATSQTLRPLSKQSFTTLSTTLADNPCAAKLLSRSKRAKLPAAHCGSRLSSRAEPKNRTAAERHAAQSAIARKHAR